MYGTMTQRAMAGMENSGAPDLAITARVIYSYFISNADILTAAESSFAAIAVIIPQDVHFLSIPLYILASQDY